MPTLPVRKVKARLSEVIETARETGEAVIITQNGEGTAVLQGLASYEAMHQSLAMLKLVVTARGKSVANDAVFRGLRKRVRANGR